MAIDEREIREYEEEAEALAAEEGDEVEGMTLDDLSAIIRRDMEAAVQYMEEEVAPRRVEAVQYYDRDPFGDEQEGRSKYISADVHDVVRGIMPDLLRIFFGSEVAVEYSTRNEAKAAFAQQATDYVNQVVMNTDNCGFLEAYEAFHDALLKGVGAIKWWWEEFGEGDILTYTGLDPQLWAMLAAEELDVEVVSQTVGADGLVDGTIRRVRAGGRIRIDAIPPEELFWDREAVSLDSARLVAHRRVLTASELIGMGYEWDEVEPHLGSGRGVDTTLERQERFGYDVGYEKGKGPDEAMSPVLYTEVYRFIDYDGDGKAELRRLCCIGDNYEVYRSSIVDERPFALFGPDPVPHSLTSGSVADLVKDIQRLKTRLIRAMLDSLGRAVDPKQVLLDGQVNADDVANPNLGGVIREYQAGAYRVMELPFVGGQVMPVLQYVDETRTRRTGLLDQGKGLTADILQSTTASAVQMASDASRAQVEMIARIFAETGWKRLFKGILRTLVLHQAPKRTVQLRGTFVPMDPRVWDSGMDVRVNVALGGGLPQEKIQVLGLLAAKQEQIIATMGPVNPLFGLRQYGLTLQKIAELGGITDVSTYVSSVPPDWQPEPPPEKPDPNLIIAQAEMMKAEIQQMKVQLDHQFAVLKEQMVDNRERDRMQLQALMAAYDAEVQGGLQQYKREVEKVAQSKED